MEQEIRIGTLVREFLVDSTGNIAAYITDGEHFCYPVVRDRTHDPSTLVFNLHWLAQQTTETQMTEIVGYNFILLSGVYHRYDDADFKRSE